ncbi:MAG TPA: M48 family metallopeptidase [Candidatus Deferrimicrobiaceae bacterium]|nr:M48 family metallopeptidase [Candidatus Deferrimicrobiaceae bacterium]
MSRRYAVVALLLLVLAPSGCETVPYTGRRQVQFVSPNEEAQMGVQAFQQIVGKATLSTDTQVNALVQRVGSRIAAVTELPYQWEFRVIQDDKQANAFALPGGKVAVYTGMLSVTRDEPGLAAVLGHEIAHVLARHGGERLSQQMGVQTVTQLLAGMASSNPATVQLVSAALGAGAQVGVLLPWGRAQESEADHVGLILMAKAGYDPRAALDLWKRMGEAAKGQRPPEFLSTHPAEATRIQQIEGWLPEALTYYRPAR